MRNYRKTRKAGIVNKGRIVGNEVKNIVRDPIIGIWRPLYDFGFFFE